MKTKWWLLLLFWMTVHSLEGQIATVENRKFGCPGASLKFYTTTPLTSYNWDLGGLSFPNIDSPVQIFNNPGTYIIKVGNLIDTITIYSKPSISIACDSPKQGCIPYTVQLRNTSILPPGLSIVEARWLYGDGGTSYGDTTSKTFTIKHQFESFVHLYLKFTPPGCDVDTQFNQYLLMDSVPMALIQANPDFLCQLPRNVLFTNLTGESPNSKMTYQWKWRLPSLDSTTVKQLGTKTYTNVNGMDTIILTAYSQMGCLGRDTAVIRIDTIPFDYFIVDTTCVKTPRELVLLTDKNRDSFRYEFIQNSIFFIQSVKQDSWFYNLINKKVKTGLYPFTIKKINKRDTSCSKILTKQILVINEIPKLLNLSSPKCNLINVDTLILLNQSPLVRAFKIISNLADRISYPVSSKLYMKVPPDTITLDTLDYHWIDSFYRKGNLTKDVNVEYEFKGTGCKMDTTYNYIDSALFYSFLTSDKTEGCKGMTVSFYAHPNETHLLDSVYWYVDNGTLIESNKVDTPYWSDTIKRTFFVPGKYKVFAVTVNKNGCHDTTAPIWITVVDSMIPQVSISANPICINDTITISKIGTTHFDRLYFSGEDYRAYNCPSDTTIVWRKFNHAGKHYVRTYALKDGCATMGLDSFTVKGPSFYLDYDFKCNRRDSIKFYLSNLEETSGMSFLWNFNDGSPLITQIQDTLWHKYTVDSGDFFTTVKALNTDPLGCPFEDSTLIHIRKVKALFRDTLFCKSSDNSYNTFPYYLNPTQSSQADYAVCNYQYSWLFEWKGKKYQPISTGVASYYDLPYDSLNMSLVARDINGCTDTFTKYVEMTSNYLEFHLNKNYRLGERYCRPAEYIYFQSNSASRYGIETYNWTIFKRNRVTLVFDTIYQAFNANSIDSFFINPDRLEADTFYITHSILDKDTCSPFKSISDTFIFFKDTSKIIGIDTICESGLNLFRLTKDNSAEVHYQWYKNNILIPNDTSYFLKDSLNGQRNQYITYHLKLVRTHRISGCRDTLFDTIVVTPRPALRIDNTFDTASQKCPFSFGGTTTTTIKYTDSNNTNMTFSWKLNGNTYGLNPATMPLNIGYNNIKGYFYTYNCVDSILNIDTVVDPYTILKPDKTKICRGDQITFDYLNMIDVDSIEMSFGDGYDYKKGRLLNSTSHSVSHNYLTKNITRDTLSIYYTIYAENSKCQRSFDTFITIKDVESFFIPNRGGDTSYCFGPVPLQNIITLGDSFVWDFGNGVKDTNRFLTEYNYNTPGTYPITLTSYRLPEKCKATYTRTLILHPYPKLKVQIDSTCLHLPVKINYTVSVPNSKVNIFPDSLKGNPHSSSPILTRIKEDTTIRLIAITPAGCRDTIDSAAVKFRPFDLKSFDTIVVSGSRVKLPIEYTSQRNYRWISELKDPTCILCPDPELQFIIPTRYKLVLTDIKGCHTDTADFYVDIYPDILVRVPTAFTPNGDGVNDIVYARGYGIKKLLNFKIYDRLGQLLFVSYDEKHGWDGYYKDKLQNSDPYFYTYEAESFIPGKIVSGEGSFMLLR